MKYIDETPNLEVRSIDIMLKYVCHSLFLSFLSLFFSSLFYLLPPLLLSLPPIWKPTESPNLITLTHHIQAKIELIKALKDICEGKMYVEGESAQLHLTLAKILEEGMYIRAD